MTTFALLPGAGGAATWFYHRLVPLLEGVGHEALPIDLPGADEHAALPEYARIAAEAIGERSDVVLVAQSLGGFTAPLVAQDVALRGLVLLNAMIPVPGETPGDWWENTGSGAARRAAAVRGGYDQEFDEAVYFLHDVSPAALGAGPPAGHDEAGAVFASPCRFTAWPATTIRVVAGADDRFFPVDFQREVARERLGVEADVLQGGHLLALSQPAALAAYLFDV